jgi:hypothetical protein
MTAGSWAAISGNLASLLAAPAPALVAALVMEGAFIGDQKAQTPGASNEAAKRILAKLAGANSGLIYTDSREQRQPTGMAKIEAAALSPVTA